MPVSYTEHEVQPLKHFLVKIEGLTDKYVKGELKRLHAPSQLWDETQGLCEEGVILKAPLSLKHDWPNLVGKKVIFSFVEAHSVIKKDSLMVKGCLLINPVSIIQVDNKTYGQWLFCERIPIQKSRIISPITKVTSNDTARAPEVNMYDYHLDKGVVARENEHLPVGTPVFWGKPSYANQQWQAQNGFLLKYRSLMASGEEVMDWKAIKI